MIGDCVCVLGDAMGVRGVCIELTRGCVFVCVVQRMVVSARARGHTQIARRRAGVACVGREGAYCGTREDDEGVGR